MKWEKVFLRDYTTKIGSGVTPKGGASVYQDSGVALFRSQNIYNGSFLDKGLAFINEVIAEKMKSVEVIEGDVLLNITGDSVARCCYAPVDYLPGRVNQHVAIVRADKEKLHSKFLMYQLISPFMQNTMLSYAVGAGATRNALTKGIIEDLKIYLPSLPTQRKIASILSAYDDLIENNLKRIKLLEEKVFLRYKQIVKEEKYLKKSPLGLISTVTSSKRIFLSDYVEEGIPFYRSKEIIAKSNFESIEKPLYITEERYSDIKEKFGIPQNGDLLITSVGTIGYVHLVNDDDGDFYFKDGNLIWIRNIANPNLWYFLFFKFRTQEFREMLNSFAIGSSQKALTIETVKKIEIDIPQDETLYEFNNECKSIIKFIYNLQKQNTKLREARDILLPKLMSGQIEV